MLGFELHFPRMSSRMKFFRGARSERARVDRQASIKVASRATIASTSELAKGIVLTLEVKTESALREAGALRNPWTLIVACTRRGQRSARCVVVTTVAAKKTRLDARETALARL